MRIRKRFLHQLSSLLPSDPKHLNRSPSPSPLVVQVQQQHPLGNNNSPHSQECIRTNSQPSDLPNQPPDHLMKTLDENPRWVSSLYGDDEDSMAVPKDLEDEEVNDDDGEQEEKRNSISDVTISKECTLNAEVDISVLQSSSSSDQDGRWSGCSGDDETVVVPLKKRRRGRFIERSTTELLETFTCTTTTAKATKWKSKTNKKCIQQLDLGCGYEKTTKDIVGGGDDNIGNNSTATKKRKRGNVIMEGSRCSRVNGRGWRCCQETLVGYSLCEHHLGKGRIRTKSSSNNVRIHHDHHQDLQAKVASDETAAPDEEDEMKNNAELLLLIMLGEHQQEKKKKQQQHGKKVKAATRSISSLLVQTDEYKQ